MGRSFFLGNEAELQTGSANFAARIATAFADYGLTEAQADAYVAANTTWQAAYSAAKEAATRGKATVQAKNDAKAVIKSLASDYASIIKGQDVSNEQLVELGLSVRSLPSPMGPPGTVTDFKVGLNGDGSLTTRWKCHNPTGCNGVLYQLWRRVGAGSFEYIGGTGDKKFTDATVPAGATSITYQIQAVRSTSVGPWAQFNVNFGTGGGGAAVTQGVPVKIAA